MRDFVENCPHFRCNCQKKSSRRVYYAPPFKVETAILRDGFLKGDKAPGEDPKQERRSQAKEPKILHLNFDSFVKSHFHLSVWNYWL